MYALVNDELKTISDCPAVKCMSESLKEYVAKVEKTICETHNVMAVLKVKEVHKLAMDLYEFD